MRLAVVASHPIQYQAPLFRELASRIDLEVFFAHRDGHEDQARAGFGVGFQWDIDLLSGYKYCFLQNVASEPRLDSFVGCDTPSISGILAKTRFDAILVMGWHLKCFWQTIWAAKRSRTPVMVRGDSHLDTPRGMFKKLGKKLLYPVALRAFDAALYVGVRSRQYWEYYGYPKDRLIFSPHCVDNNWFSEKATPAAPPAARIKLRTQHNINLHEKVILFAGKLIGLKRPLDLVDAVTKLKTQQRAPLVMVAGSGALEAPMLERAAANDIPIVHLGFCNQSQMPAVYAAADMLALTSDSETWGLTANEALTCARPVIVSDACGCGPDLAADNQAGRIFPVGDISALAAAIASVINTPPKLDALFTKATAYSVEAAADGVCLALERLATSDVITS